MYKKTPRTLLVLLPFLLLLAACSTDPGPQNNQLPVINSFTATPTNFTPGETVTLTWEVEHAKTVHLNNGEPLASGTTSITVTPSVKTTYTLRAVNPNGETSRQVVVTPKPNDTPREPTLPEEPENPDNGNPDDPENPVAPDPTEVIFDFSDAIGLQTGTIETPGTLNTQSSTRPSGLLKVTSNGSLVDPLVNGDVRVNHFVIRNGRIYLLLEPNHYSESDIARCVLAEVDQHNQLSCLDDELAHIEHSTLQFDAHGGVYYRGSTDPWLSDSLIRRSYDGEITDYYTIRDTSRIERFYVTREGLVIMAGYTSGSIGTQYWLRTVDENSNVHDVEWPTENDSNGWYGEYYNLRGFLPDGSLMAQGPRGFRRILLHNGALTVDTKTYPQRFNIDEYANSSEVFSYFQIASGQAVHLAPYGLTRIYPTVEDIALPYTNILTGTISHNMVALAGRGLSGEYQAGYYDLNTNQYTEILDGHRIDVARLLLQQDQARILMYGLNLNGNVPVLAEYDLNHRVLNIATIGGELAEQFEIIDWSISHVAPEPLVWTPEPDFSFEAETGWYEGRVHFDANATPNLPFMNELNWDFGDGNTATGVTTTHFYEEPGTYTVTLEAINDHGNVGYYSTTVTVDTAVINDLISTRDLTIFDTSHGYYTYSGYPENGLLGNGRADNPGGLPHLIEELSPSTVTRFAQGTNYMLALTDDGVVHAWGQNREGHLGMPANLTQLYAPQVIPGLHNIVGIAIVGNTNFALTGSGTLYYWGVPNFNPASGLGDLSPTHTPTLLVTDRFPENLVDITSGNNGNTGGLFLRTTDGSIYAWGHNTYGNLGVSETAANVWHATLVDIDSEITSVQAHEGFPVTFFLTNDGQVYAAGDNRYESTGIPLTTETRNMYTPTLVPLPGAVRTIGNIYLGSSASTFAVTTDNTVIGWGRDSNFPINPTQNALPPTVFENLPPVTSIVRDKSSNSMLAFHDGRLYSWGGTPPNIFIRTDRPRDDQGEVNQYLPYVVR